VTDSLVPTSECLEYVKDCMARNAQHVADSGREIKELEDQLAAITHPERRNGEVKELNAVIENLSERLEGIGYESRILESIVHSLERLERFDGANTVRMIQTR
jgi:uncharacterized protein (UPF0335 family)